MSELAPPQCLRLPVGQDSLVLPASVVVEVVASAAIAELAADSDPTGEKPSPSPSGG